MNALRLLKGANWEAEKRPLLNIYQSIIRPVMKYGMEAYFFSLEASLAPLFKVQSEALRLCTGAMRSTPTICLQHSCNTPVEKCPWRWGMSYSAWNTKPIFWPSSNTRPIHSYLTVGKSAFRIHPRTVTRKFSIGALRFCGGGFGFMQGGLTL